MDEEVQLFDADGRPTGTAPRSRVRRDNLRHGATGVVVRDRLGRIYVHRRADTKDVYPGLYDCTAGGVIGAGEDPDEAARRELEEELGVVDSKLRRIAVDAYADNQTSYVAFQYETYYDGPISWQPEEVVWGTWMTLEELVAHLADPQWPFMPDSRALFDSWLGARVEDRVEVDDGWDSQVTILEGRWIDRVPRRDEVRGWLLAETSLLPRLAPLLPLHVPVPEVVADDPLRVRHRIVAGEPIGAEGSPSDGRRLGAFLRTLHDVPLSIIDGTGVRDAATAKRELDHTLDRFAYEVAPRLPGSLLSRAAKLLERTRRVPHSSVVHGDLGPAHVLRDDGVVSGVIDWADTHIGDPAIDLAWAMFGAGQEFADGIVEAYGVRADERERALDWHRLGPWHEVIYGLDNARPELVESGIQGVVDRLSGS